MNKKEPKVLTRMRLSCCWGDNLNEKELNEVVDYINWLQQKVNQLESTLNEVRAIVSKSVFKTDLVELCRMKNQIKEILDKVGGSNG